MKFWTSKLSISRPVNCVRELLLLSSIIFFILFMFLKSKYDNKKQTLKICCSNLLVFSKYLFVIVVGILAY